MKSPLHLTDRVLLATNDHNASRANAQKEKHQSCSWQSFELALSF